MERAAHNNPKHFDYSALCSWLHETYFTRGQGDKTKHIALNQGISRGQFFKGIRSHSCQGRRHLLSLLLELVWAFFCLFVFRWTKCYSIHEKNKQKNKVISNSFMHLLPLSVYLLHFCICCFFSWNIQFSEIIQKMKIHLSTVYHPFFSPKKILSGFL